MRWANITLKDIVVLSPKQSPGVVLGNPARPMENVVFDNVVVTPADPSAKPWRKAFYKCDGVHGLATGGTSPPPPCFNTTTTSTSTVSDGCGSSCSLARVQFPPISGCVCRAPEAYEQCCAEGQGSLCADNASSYPLCNSDKGRSVCPGNTGGSAKC